MKFKIITLFPNLIQAMTAEGVIQQAQKKELISIECIQPRDFTEDTHKTVDDRPFGGGDGMVMMPAPMKAAIEKAKTTENSKVIYLSPQGLPLNQQIVDNIAQSSELVLICGRYAGIDQRLINQYVDLEISIGDYVLSGGELAAAVVVDAVARKIPGVLGHADSADQDSFSASLEGFLEAPNFTRPREFSGEQVPEILLSGDHKKIAEWKKMVSILTTLSKRPDLIFEARFSDKEKKSILKFWDTMSATDKSTLGLHGLSENDFELLQKGSST